jgi:predicted MPP superfamily phosphohydrolase
MPFSFCRQEPMATIGFVLFASAWVGHTALLVGSLNWWYGNPLPHRFLTGLRLLHGLLVLAFPVGFWLAYEWDPSRVLSFDSARAGWGAFAGYVILCWSVAFGALPVITWARRRRPPAVLLHNHTRTIDMTAQLGYKPVGWGKYRLLARLPGNDIFRVDFTERTLCLPQLPSAWEGLTILHLSDLHLCGTPDRQFHEQVMDVCRAWDPDILALTGDIIDSDWHHRWILPVLGRLRWRLAAFAIVGNHDSWYDAGLVRRRLSRLGMDLVGSRWRQLQVRGEPLIIVGHEGPWFLPAPDMSACPAGVFRLCLSHTPDNIRWAQRHGIDLMLAGHNHGGQIRFPVFGSVLVPSRYSRRFDCGTFEEGPTVLHVSRGLAGQHPLRYNCRPEITKLILTK